MAHQIVNTGRHGGPKYRRTQRLLDPKWQLGMACAVTMLLLGAGATYTLVAEFLDGEWVRGALGAGAYEAVRVGTDILFFGAVAVFVHKVIVRLTHSVVGPAMVIERALAAMEGGDLDARLRLRDGDYLKPLAAAAASLQSRLGGTREESGALLARLREAVGDDAAALELISSLEELHGVEVESSVAGDDADPVDGAEQRAA